MTIGVALLALILAFMKIRGLTFLRAVVVLFALGAGQIHLATLALLAWLFAEAGYRIPRYIPRRILQACAVCLVAILLISTLSPISERMVFEFVQLILYLIILVLLVTYIRTAAQIDFMLRAMVVAGLLYAVVGIVLTTVGITEPPHVYLGRGGNEGALYVLLVGVVPAGALFTKTRRPIYLGFVAIMLLSQVLATSRTNIVLTVLVAGLPVIFLIRSRLVRYSLVLLLGVCLYVAVGQISSLFEEQLNYSTLQRFSLYDAGWSLWLERPWTGWGWGSTSQLAPEIRLTDLEYPHFHSTYIQLIVELGVLGWLFIAIWVFGSVSLTFFGRPVDQDPGGNAYITGVAIGLLGAGWTEALLFGADRAIQVMLTFALVIALMRRT